MLWMVWVVTTEWCIKWTNGLNLSVSLPLESGVDARSHRPQPTSTSTTRRLSFSDHGLRAASSHRCRRPSDSPQFYVWFTFRELTADGCDRRVWPTGVTDVALFLLWSEAFGRNFWSEESTFAVVCLLLCWTQSITWGLSAISATDSSGSVKTSPTERLMTASFLRNCPQLKCFIFRIKFWYFFNWYSSFVSIEPKFV